MNSDDEMTDDSNDCEVTTSPRFERQLPPAIRQISLAAADLPPRRAVRRTITRSVIADRHDGISRADQEAINPELVLPSDDFEEFFVGEYWFAP